MRCLTITGLLCWFVLNGQAQLPHNFALQSQTITERFPKLMAFHGSLDFTFTAHRRFLGVEGTPTTYQASSAGYVDRLHTAFGGVYEYDRLGAMRTHRLAGSLSPRIVISDKWVVSGAASFLYSQNKSTIPQ